MAEENNAAGGGANGAAAHGGAGAAGSATITFPGWVEGQLGKERVESLRTDVTKDPDLLKDISAIKGNGELFDSWRALRDSSKGTVRIPKEGAAKEEWDQYWKAVGRPASPRDYAFEKPTLPEGMSYSEQWENWFRDTAHANGLTAAQFKAIYEGFNKLNIDGFSKVSTESKTKKEAAEKDAVAAREKQIADTKTTLTQEWGKDYPARMKAAVDFIHKQPKAYVEKLQAAGLLRDSDFLKYAEAYARATAEDRILGLASEGGTGAEEEQELTPQGRPKLKVHVAKR